MIDWWIVFYTVSTIFQPYNGSIHLMNITGFHSPTKMIGFLLNQMQNYLDKYMVSTIVSQFPCYNSCPKKDVKWYIAASLSFWYNVQLHLATTGHYTYSMEGRYPFSFNFLIKFTPVLKYSSTAHSGYWVYNIHNYLKYRSKTYKDV